MYQLFSCDADIYDKSVMLSMADVFHAILSANHLIVRFVATANIAFTNVAQIVPSNIVSRLVMVVYIYWSGMFVEWRPIFCATFSLKLLTYNSSTISIWQFQWSINCRFQFLKYCVRTIGDWTGYAHQVVPTIGIISVVRFGFVWRRFPLIWYIPVRQMNWNTDRHSAYILQSRMYVMTSYRLLLVFHEFVCFNRTVVLLMHRYVWHCPCQCASVNECNSYRLDGFHFIHGM